LCHARRTEAISSIWSGSAKSIIICFSSSQLRATALGTTAPSTSNWALTSDDTAAWPNSMSRLAPLPEQTMPWVAKAGVAAAVAARMAAIRTLRMGNV
jgi:hypothetical protein